MEEDAGKIIRFRPLYLMHIFVYIVFATVCILNILGAFSLDVSLNARGVFLPMAVIFLVFSISDFISFLTNDFIFKRNWKVIVYRSVQLCVFLVYYILMPFSAMNIACIGIISLYCVEYVFIFNLDERYKRIILYVIVFISFIITTLIEMIKRLDFFEGVVKFATMSVVIGCIVMICEVLAKTYNYYFGLLMAQHRMVEGLNEANEKLNIQKEEIKSVNELLGLQKIELQTANKKINRSHDEMSVQNEISDVITSNKEQDALCESICSILRVRLTLDMVCLVVEPDASDEFKYSPDNVRKFYYNHMFDDNYSAFLNRILSNGMVDDLLELSGTYIQNNHSTHNVDIKNRDEKEIMESLIMIPLTGQSNEKVGNLIIGKHNINSFMDNRTFYENIANQISIGIENMRLYERMHLMATLDGLTHILNRRSLTEELNVYLNEAWKSKTSVSLALFDIDKFKIVNDTYGHQCGDVVIQYVANTLDKAARKNGGIAGRYGGEEFVMAFKGIGLDEVMKIVKNAHSDIKEGVVHYEEKSISVTSSAGVAVYPDTCENPAELLTRADWAMYHSKKNGRDRITIDSDEVEHML